MRRLLPLGLLLFVPLSALAQRATADLIQQTYKKVQIMIPMRDGVKLFTSILEPKEDDGMAHPIMITRTPYSCAPYDPARLPARIGGSDEFIKHKYILVTQDVRGRYLSEGQFLDVRPQLLRHLKPEDIDESTDTYDTIDYLVKNVPHNNGRVGLWGISYPGGYAALGAMSLHPALKAASPQAPTADWFIGDDFHHHGVLFLQDVLSFYSGFGGPRPEPTTSPKGVVRIDDGGDAYQYYLKLGPLSNVDAQLFHGQVNFWNLVQQHPDYDEFWQARSMPENLKNLHCALLNVGGWFDAEDAYGPQACYRSANRLSPGIWDGLCLGPWYHGMWHSQGGRTFGQLDFGQETATQFKEEIEWPFFSSILEGSGKPAIAKVNVFQTGRNEWRKMESWPPRGKLFALYLNQGMALSSEPGPASEASYVSDPTSPVPYHDGVIRGRTREYMVDDQSFAMKRPDVLSYRSAVLTEDVTLAGGLRPHLMIRTDSTDVDLVVKLIDLWPASDPVHPSFAQLLRGDIFRAKYRNSYSNPKALTPGNVETVDFNMDDVFHTFKKGHQLMVQIQSSWFPLCERNPQAFMNTYLAKDSDFRPAKVEVLSGAGQASAIFANQVSGF